MGFLDIFTGSPSKSNSQTQSGFALLPQTIQDAYSQFGTAVSGQIPGITNAYKPLPQTAGETNAINNINQGFAPTAESLGQDISMFMNPFQQYVTDPAQRAAQSDFSILKQNATQAGQFGSNRQQLGANDIENTRVSNIANINAGGYTQALNSVLQSLIPQRQQDAQNALGAGTFQRGLNQQANTAGITGLQQLAQALGVLPTTGGSTGTQNATGEKKGLLELAAGFF